MNRKGLIAGLIVLGALCLAAYFTSREPHGPETGGPASGDKLLGFDINNVERLDVTGGSGTSRVERKKGVWVAPDLYDYPADFGKVASRLRDLANEHVGQVIRGGTNYLDEFGLAAGGETEDGTPTRFVLYAADGGTLGRVALGKVQTGGRYVRVDNGPVIQTKGSLSDLPTSWRDWVETKLLDVSPANIAEVRVAPTNAPAYTLVKQGTDRYRLEDLGQDEKIDTAAAGKLTRALQYFSLTGVADPSRSDEELGFEQAETYAARTTEGVKYTVSLGGPADANTRYARLSVAYEKPTPPVPPDEPSASTNAMSTVESGTATNGQSDLERARKEYATQLQEYNKRVERVGREVEETSKRFAKWTYVLEKYTCDNMLIPRNELVTETETPKTSEDSEPDS